MCLNMIKSLRNYLQGLLLEGGEWGTGSAERDFCFYIIPFCSKFHFTKST